MDTIIDTIKDILSQIYIFMLSFRQTISVSDIIDILIITFLFYQILSFMRKTSASSVIRGIVLVLIIAWAAERFEMVVLEYLLNQVLSLGLVVLIVLFQPEIRKMFEQVGSSKLNTLFRKRGRLEEVDSAIHSVAAAGAAMSKSMTGAIIVFEREVGLNDYAANGTVVDARVSPELIQNIFFLNSPLHDGALIIRSGRILAASCMLPLSNNINLNRDIGMRHRAGVGMSERSDAVVAIVSEQTGAISIAIDGMLKRNLSVETFELLLRSELIKGRRSKDKPYKEYTKRKRVSGRKSDNPRDRDIEDFINAHTGTGSTGGSEAGEKNDGHEENV